MTPAQYNAVQSIFAAALDPDLWQSAMDDMAKINDGVRTQLMHADETESRADRSFVSGYPADSLRSWDAYYAGINAWAPRMLELPVGVPHFCELMCDYDTLRRTEFYNDWVRPQGDIIGGGAVVLERSPGRLTILGGNIPRADRDRSDAAWQQSLAILGPAVRHALSINAALLETRLELILLRDAGVTGPEAILLLDQRGRLMFADHGGARALEHGRLVTIRPRLRLAFADEAMDRALAMMLAGHAPMMPLVREVGRSEVTLFPIDDKTAQTLRLPPTPISSRPRLVVIVRAKPAPKGPDLAVRLGLTAAEADLALQLAEGKTPAEVAEARGTSVHTVRNQLKSVLSKTGCRRQTELALLVQAVIRAGL